MKKNEWVSDIRLEVYQGLRNVFHCVKDSHHTSPPLTRNDRNFVRTVGGGL